MGVWVLNESHKRPAARLLGITAAGGWLMRLGSLCWEPLSRMGAAHLSVPAQLFAVLPAMYALQSFSQLLLALLKSRWKVVCVFGAVAVCGVCLIWCEMPHVLERFQSTSPLALGLNGDRQQIVKVLSEQTRDDARILWEDRSDQRSECWTALLPRLTDRAFVGGLDPECRHRT